MRQGDAKMRQVTDCREPDRPFTQGWEIFYTLAEARVLIDSYCRYPQMPTPYNSVNRPRREGYGREHPRQGRARRLLNRVLRAVS